MPDASPSRIQTVHIDGALYVFIGFLTALYASLGSDEAVKYLTPTALWWSKTIVGSINGGVLALKMYRSTAFAESKNGNGNGNGNGKH